MLGIAAISNRFCFTTVRQGNTARPGGLHARLCHAFLFLLFFVRYLSGTTGNKSVTDLRLFSSRGYSLHDGVTIYVGKATYYWSPVSISSASHFSILES